MILFENLKTIKKESNNDLYSKFNNHYDGFIPIQDLVNYCSLDQFGEFVQFCKQEADLEYDYEKRYSDYDEALTDLNNIYEYNEDDIDSISTENVFNFFSMNELEDFWNWVETEYDLDDEILSESKNDSKDNISYKIVQKEINILKNKLKKTGVVENFGQKEVRDLKDKYNQSTLMDLNYSEKNKILKAIDDFNEWCMTYTGKNKNESIKLQETIDNINSLTYFMETYNISSDRIVRLLDRWLPSTIIKGFIKDYINVYGDDLEEATSGIGGAYTTKAIDMIPISVKKSKNAKLESNTTFYGNDFTDEELIKGLEYSKEHADDWLNENVYECIKYEDKDYWVVAYNPEDEIVTFDNKDAIVALVIDEDINKYLAYFEVKWIDNSDGDPENGMKAPEYGIEEIPFKIVEI